MARFPCPPHMWKVQWGKQWSPYQLHGKYYSGYARSHGRVMRSHHLASNIMPYSVRPKPINNNTKTSQLQTSKQFRHSKRTLKRIDIILLSWILNPTIATTKYLQVLLVIIQESPLESKYSLAIVMNCVNKFCHTWWTKGDSTCNKDVNKLLMKKPHTRCKLVAALVQSTPWALFLHIPIPQY